MIRKIVMPATYPSFVNGLRTSFAVIVGVTVLGLALRLFQLESSPLELDETLSALVVARDAVSLIGFSLTYDQHPPLYPFLLHTCLDLFGQSEFTFRSLSVLFGVTCIPLIYAVTRTMTDRATAFIAAMILAISPFHISYSQEARNYTLLSCLSLASTLALLLLMKSPSRTLWIVYVACSILTIDHRTEHPS